MASDAPVPSTRVEFEAEFGELADEWKTQQSELAAQVSFEDTQPWSFSAGDGGSVPLKYIGGVDISFIKGNNVDACAALVVLEYPSLEVVYEDMLMVELTLPYIPTYLAFRETPALLLLIERIRERAPDKLPQITFVDGNGVLHPRGFGLASHFGVLTDLPMVGVAKSFLMLDGLSTAMVRDKFRETVEKAGDHYELVGASGRLWGIAYKATDDAVNPIYLSVGHQISLDTIVKLTRFLCKYRVPEPVRQADLRSRQYLRDHSLEKK
mmetsp:Transcript_7561/g.23290  ORF Transcript_7561/g.23290 Transcript_7561/m.23290 type:complete len:267 (+) Transcript_7561:85-885(+)